jgi:hypothetical protein
MPVFTNRQGQTVRTEVPSEMVRLKARGYAEGETPVPTVEEQQFHPANKPFQDVLNYIADHPEDANRVVAEEKAGQARKSIVGER